MNARLAERIGERGLQTVIIESEPVAAGVGIEIGKDDVPVGTEDFHHPAEVGQIVTQLCHRNQVELSEDLGDIVDRPLAASLFAELSDIPGGQNDGFIEAG